MADQGGEEVEETGGAQDTDGDHEADQGGHDLYDCEEPAFGSFDEIVVYVRFHQDSIGDDGEYDKGNDKVCDIKKKLHEIPRPVIYYCFIYMPFSENQCIEITGNDFV